MFAETSPPMHTKKLLFSLLLLCSISNVLFAQPCKEVVGYYPNWQWYDRNQLVKPTTLNYSKYSIINYCFFKPNPDGTIVSGDTWADDNLLLGPTIWYPVQTNDFSNSIVGKAQAANVKVLISVGGWSWSDEFPQIAANPAKRATFAGACRQLVSKYQLNGIDIDWEYPGYAGHSGTAADKHNYTVFLQQIRDSLTAYGQITSKTYLLTAAVAASPANAANIEWNNVSPILDMINLMSYDFFGAWDPTSNHNSPLFAPAQGDPAFNLNSAFSMLTQTYNVPANKINVGVAFYGRSVTGCTSLFGSTSGTADTGTFSEDDGSPMYYNIVKNMSSFTRHWDNTAKVPYLLGNSIQTFVSYDDPESIAEKAKFINSKGARGAIIWEITGDYIETSPGSGIIAHTPLVDTLNYIMCHNTPLGIESLANKNNTLSLYPNPSNGTVNISYTSIANESISMEIYNSIGELVNQQKLIADIGFNSFSICVQQRGLFYITIKGRQGMVTEKITITK